jgi:phosphonate degradation associated HDIG domain protein
MNPIDDILRLLAEHGGSQYGGERVTQLEHALQCASLAEQAKAPAATIVACLLHDLGHLLDQHARGAAERGVDRRHEDIAAGHLSRWFDQAVTEPIRGHVDAKRWLVARETGYFETLSPASVTSLRVQGGPFSPEEAERFGAKPFAGEAIRLRRWDDEAKVQGAATPPLQHFRSYLEACLRPTAG